MRITVTEMRRRFNEGRYFERMKAGEFTPVKRKFTPRQEILEAYGPDTLSFSVSYLDANGDEVVRVHQYESPNGDILYISKEDGTLRTNGLPDPKALYENGIHYRIQKEPKRQADRT